MVQINNECGFKFEFSSEDYKDYKDNEVSYFGNSELTLTFEEGCKTWYQACEIRLDNKDFSKELLCEFEKIWKSSNSYRDKKINYEQ